MITIYQFIETLFENKMSILRNMEPLSIRTTSKENAEEATLSKLSLLSSKKGSKFFPFREVSFLEGTWCTGKQTGSYNSCSPSQSKH